MHTCQNIGALISELVKSVKPGYTAKTTIYWNHEIKTTTTFTCQWHMFVFCFCGNTLGSNCHY